MGEPACRSGVLSDSALHANPRPAVMRRVTRACRRAVRCCAITPEEAGRLYEYDSAVLFVLLLLRAPAAYVTWVWAALLACVRCATSLHRAVPCRTRRGRQAVRVRQRRRQVAGARQRRAAGQRGSGRGHQQDAHAAGGLATDSIPTLGLGGTEVVDWTAAPAGCSCGRWGCGAQANFSV